MFVLPLDSITSLLTSMLRKTDYSRSMQLAVLVPIALPEILANKCLYEPDGNARDYILNGIIHLFALYSIAIQDSRQLAACSDQRQK